jgi:very-short-patch-repair endonuclease
VCIQTILVMESIFGKNKRGKPYDLTGIVTSVKTNKGRKGRSPYSIGVIKTNYGEFEWVLKDSELQPPKINDYVTLSGVMEKYKGVTQLQVSFYSTEQGGVNKAILIERESTPITERPADIIRYYRSCIERERDGNTRVASIDNLPWFTNKGSVFFETFETSELFKTGVNSRHDNWFAKQLLRDEQIGLRVGYPTIKFSGLSGFSAPLAFIEVEVSLTEGGYLLSRTSERLYWNLAGLEALGISEDIRDAVLLKLNEVSESLDNDKVRLEKGLEYLSDISLLNLRRDLALNPTSVDLDDNRSILYREVIYEGSDNKISDSLITDLGGMINSEIGLTSGPLAVYLGNKVQQIPTKKDFNLITVLSSSPDQIRAIKAVLGSELSCITGPPGTGKSQFVANLASVAFANGLSVLIASKNNQAVDVAISRLRLATPSGWPIRTGSRVKKEEASKILSGDISRKRNHKIVNIESTQEFKEWKKITNTTKELQAKLAISPDINKALVKLREELSIILESGKLVVTSQSDLDKLSKIYKIVKEYDELFRLKLPILFKRKKCKNRRLKFEEKLNEMPTSAPIIESYIRQLIKLNSNYSPENMGVLSEACGEIGEIIGYSQRYLNIVDEIDIKEKLLSDIGTDLEINEQLRNLDNEAAIAGRKLVNIYWDNKLDDEAAVKLSLLCKALMAQNSKILKGRITSSLNSAPVWATTNLSVFPNFPLVPGLFDLAIIDEASQNDIASVLPILFRSKSAVLVGDPNQLTHISGLSRVEANDIAKKYNIDLEDNVGYDYKEVSAFERALEVTECTVLLSEHYRSHPAISEFANKYVYAGRLDICTDPRKYYKGDGLFWHDTQGVSGKRNGKSLFNHLEALEIVKKISDIIAVEPEASIGVVTPFSSQALHIEDLLIKDANVDKIKGRNIRVSTAHKFQGDERDYILLSTVISENSDEFSINFANTPNLVNVAVTRAKRQLHVFGSKIVCQNAGGLLGKLADYAESLAYENFESPAEQKLYHELEKAGFSVETQVKIDKYRVDLLITLPKINKKIIVECDGHPFHKDIVRDEMRDRDLSNLGYSILHIPARLALGYGSSALEMVRNYIKSL